MSNSTVYFGGHEAVFYAQISAVLAFSFVVNKDIQHTVL